MIVTILSRLILGLRAEPQLFSFPYIDDAFYVFNYASHFANGQGFTVNGVEQTNGVHPLIVAIYAPLYFISGGDKVAAIRLSFIITALIDALCVYGIAVLSANLNKRGKQKYLVIPILTPPVISALIWTVAESIIINTTNGLETALYSLLIITSLLQYVAIWNNRNAGASPTIAQWITLGIMLGFTVLARIDGILLVIAFFLYELISQERTEVLLRAASLSIVPFCISSPWWIYNYVTFGSLFPISGQSESLSYRIGENLHFAAIALSNMISMMIRLPFWGAPIYMHILWVGGASILIITLHHKYQLLSLIKKEIQVRVLIPLIITASLVITYYVFFFGAPYFIDRYFQPLRIFAIIVWSYGVTLVYSSIINRSSKKDAVLLGKVVLGILLLAVSFNAYKFTNYFRSGNTSTLYLAGLWAAEHPDNHIGMIQSGTANYLAANVTNLDGKVNTLALSARKHSSLGRYVDQASLSYVIDWPDCIRDYLGTEFMTSGKFVLSDSLISKRNAYPPIVIYQEVQNISVKPMQANKSLARSF